MMLWWKLTSDKVIYSRRVRCSRRWTWAVNLSWGTLLEVWKKAENIHTQAALQPSVFLYVCVSCSVYTFAFGDGFRWLNGQGSRWMWLYTHKATFKVFWTCKMETFFLSEQMLVHFFSFLMLAGICSSHEYLVGLFSPVDKSWFWRQNNAGMLHSKTKSLANSTVMAPINQPTTVKTELTDISVHGHGIQLVLPVFRLSYNKSNKRQHSRA